MAQELPPIPPNTYFLSRESTWEESVWFHGTRSGKLEGVLQHGLVPRHTLKSAGNWALHPSAKGMVYVTTAYALHYAKATEGEGLPAILELDLSKLDRKNFFADEDTYALSPIEDMPSLSRMSTEKRVEFWRNNLEATDALTSLRIMGNATHRGVIPADAIKRVRLLTEREALTLTLQISDPVVSPQNFKLMGGASQRFTKWLTGHKTDLDEWFERACRPSVPVMSLPEAVEYHRAQAAAGAFQQKKRPAAG